MSKEIHRFQDVVYFFRKSGTYDRLNSSSLHLNAATDKEDERNFWNRVRPNTVAKLYKEYEDDFEIYGYSARNYFEELGATVIDENRK